MSTSYGVVWREGTLPPGTGKLELLPRAFSLEGLADSLPVEREVPYEGLVGVRVGRTSAERINGRLTVVVEPRRGLPISIATVEQASLVGEIVERLSALVLRSEGGRRVALVSR
jgi:hypothetical protein